MQDPSAPLWDTEQHQEMEETSVLSTRSPPNLHRPLRSLGFCRKAWPLPRRPIFCTTW